jgi:hypothetical protein
MGESFLWFTSPGYRRDSLRPFTKSAAQHANFIGAAVIPKRCYSVLFSFLCFWVFSGWNICAYWRRLHPFSLAFCFVHVRLTAGHSIFMILCIFVSQYCDYEYGVYIDMNYIMTILF